MGKPGHPPSWYLIPLKWQSKKFMEKGSSCISQHLGRGQGYEHMLALQFLWYTLEWRNVDVVGALGLIICTWCFLISLSIALCINCWCHISFGNPFSTYSSSCISVDYPLCQPNLFGLQNLWAFHTSLPGVVVSFPYLSYNDLHCTLWRPIS